MFDLDSLRITATRLVVWNLLPLHHFVPSTIIVLLPAAYTEAGSSTVPCFPPPPLSHSTKHAKHAHRIHRPSEQADTTCPAQTAAHRLPGAQRRHQEPHGSGRSKRRLSHRIDGDGRRSPAGAAAGGGAPVLRALRGAAHGHQEGPQPLRRRLRHHRRQRRRRAQGQGRHLQHPEPPHHPRRRRDAPPHHARKGVQHAPQMGGVQRGQHQLRRPALQREDNFTDPTEDGDGCLLGREHRAAGLRLQDQGQLLRQVLRLLPWRLQHHGCSNEP